MPPIPSSFCVTEPYHPSTTTPTTSPSWRGSPTPTPTPRHTRRRTSLPLPEGLRHATRFDFEIKNCDSHTQPVGLLAYITAPLFFRILLVHNDSYAHTPSRVATPSAMNLSTRTANGDAKRERVFLDKDRNRAKKRGLKRKRKKMTY